MINVMVSQEVNVKASCENNYLKDEFNKCEEELADCLISIGKSSEEAKCIRRLIAIPVF